MPPRDGFPKVLLDHVQCTGNPGIQKYKRKNIKHLTVNVITANYTMTYVSAFQVRP